MIRRGGTIDSPPMGGTGETRNSGGRWEPGYVHGGMRAGWLWLGRNVPHQATSVSWYGKVEPLGRGEHRWDRISAVYTSESVTLSPTYWRVSKQRLPVQRTPRSRLSSR